ncbi:ankyrin repeat domain-containing protein 26 isoform X2 [Syngnathus scovelli]|uniref:ankyrin repeat domain-containing protein 26 isoform X2 n=1 Tax=Syngnathus scovelli TaxID=161590 RepID=UPI00210FE49A|nr:ankyrin repeat domain-containing protein 26 isoform X2 [Syngnathus scovelli]
MKKLFSFSKKKQSPSRAADRGNALCVGYEVKEKDLGKFHKAAWRGDVAKLEHLVKSNDVNQVDKHNRTALHLACACGNAEVVRFLVAKKAKLNLCDNQNKSALIKAVQGQHDVCATILLENHADPNLVDTEGNTALHFASSIPSTSTVDTLVDHDADINAQNKEGISPLTVAVQEDHIEVAEILLKKRADVNILDRDGRSPLMIAAGNGYISMLRMLLQFHADISLKDNKGHSAEDYAAIEGHHPCAILITEHSTQRNRAASLSHPGPSKKKSKSELGNASPALETGFSVGGPAIDKDDFEDNSQAESLSQLSKKGGTDEWVSSEDDCESLIVEKTPPKMNLRKMLESKKGRAEGKRGEIEQLSGNQSSSESEDPSSEGDGSEEEEEDEEEDEEEESEEIEEEEEEEESEDDSCLASGQSNTSSSEDAPKPPSLLQAELYDGKAPNKHSSDGAPVKNSSQVPGTSPSHRLQSLDADQDLVVSAVRVESKYSDEDDELMLLEEPEKEQVDDDDQTSQRNMLAKGTIGRTEKRRSSWGSSLEETDNHGCQNEDDITSRTSCPKTRQDQQIDVDETPPPKSPRSKKRASPAESVWDSPSEEDGAPHARRNPKVTAEEQLVEEASPAPKQNEHAARNRDQPDNQPADDQPELSENKKDRVALQNPQSSLPHDEMLEEEKMFTIPSGRISGGHSDGSALSEPLPQTDIDDVDLDSADENEEDENDASHEDPADDDDDDGEEEEEEGEEEEEDMSDDQDEGNRVLPDATKSVAETSKDAKSGDHSESGLEKEEQESWDSENEDKQSAQAQNTAPETVEDDLLFSPSFLRGAGGGWMPEPWWSRGRQRGSLGVGLGAVASIGENKDSVQDRDVQKEDPTQKDNEQTKWGLLLSKCEGKSKDKSDLMEELGLGDFDYAEDASDWDTSSNVSKKSLPDGTSPVPEESPQSSSKEKESLKAPIATPRRIEADENLVPDRPHPQPRSKTVPQKSDTRFPSELDHDQDESTPSCVEADDDNRQRQEAVSQGRPEVQTMAEDPKSHLQHDKKQEEKDDALESGDLTSHKFGLISLVANVARAQQSPDDDDDDEGGGGLPLAPSEKLWEEVENKDAKSTLACEEQLKADISTDDKQVKFSSADEQSSDEEEGEAILRPAAPARKLLPLSGPEQQESASEDSAADSADSSLKEEKIPDRRLPAAEGVMDEEAKEPLHSRVDPHNNPELRHKHQPEEPEKNRHSTSYPLVAYEDFEEDVENMNLEIQKEVIKETPEAAIHNVLGSSGGSAFEGLAVEKPESGSASRAEDCQQTQKLPTSDSRKPENVFGDKTSLPAGGSKAHESSTRQIDNRELSLFDDSTLSDASDHERRHKTGEQRQKQQSEDIEMSEDIDEFNSSSDVTTDDSDFRPSGHRPSSLFIQNLDSFVTDSRSMVKLQNIFHKYERSIQKAKSRHSFFADKVSLLETEKAQLRSALDEVKDVKSALERNQLDLQTEVTNLKFQLKQEQEKGRNATMMYNTTGDKLRRTEEQRQAELQERQKVELTLRNLELEMRILVNNKKQLEEDNSQTQTLLAQERSARTVLENLLGSHVRKQQEVEEENKRNISKSHQALSQLTEASDRERELLQQISICHAQLSTLRRDLENSQANSSIRQRDLQEENKALKEQLEEARQALKSNTDTLNQTVLDFNNQTATVKSELTVTAGRLENERQTRETLAAELESVRARLTAALQEAERCMAARSDAEKALLHEKEEHRRLRDRLSSDASSQHEAVNSLSQKLSKAESQANHLENEAHRVMLQLTEKNLLLNTMQRESDHAAARVKELEAALQAEKELLTRAVARQEAMKERLAQAQSEGMLLRQQLEEAQNKGAAKENAVTDAQKSFSDILSKLRSDCEERVQLVHGRNQDLATKAAELRDHIHQLQEEKNEREASERQLQQELADSLKKLSMSEASLEINTRYRNDLEEEKTRLLKDLDNLKGKIEERESQCLQFEKRLNDLRCRLDERESELVAATQKQQEALSAAAASDAVVKQLEEAVQRLEIENVRLEAAAKQQSNKLEALHKGAQEEARLPDSANGGMIRAQLEDLVTNLQSNKMTLEDQLNKEVQKQSMLSNTAHDSQAMWEEELKSRSKLGLRLAELEKEKGELGGQVEMEKKKAKKVAEQKKAVDCRLEQEMERNTALQKEIYRLRTLLKTAKKRLRDQSTGGGGHDFTSPLSSLKIDHSRADRVFHERREKGDLERGALQGSLSETRLLEEEVLNLKRRVEASAVEQRQMEQYRREVEEKARQEIQHKLQEVNIFLQSQAATQEAQDQIKAANEASLRLRIQELESELNRARAFQHDTFGQRESTRTELERFKELYREEQELRKSLSADLKRTNHQLTEASSMLVTERGRSLIASPGPPPTPSGGVATLGDPYRGLASRLLGPVAEGQSSSVEDYLTMMQRQLDRSISRELNKASTELDISLARMSPVGSASRVDLDPVSRAKQQYLEVLKKNHEV